jgi:hypothetical protein
MALLRVNRCAAGKELRLLLRHVSGIPVLIQALQDCLLHSNCSVQAVLYHIETLQAEQVTMSSKSQTWDHHVQILRVAIMRALLASEGNAVLATVTSLGSIRWPFSISLAAQIVQAVMADELPSWAQEHGAQAHEVLPVALLLALSALQGRSLSCSCQPPSLSMAGLGVFLEDSVHACWRACMNGMRCNCP